MFGVPDIWLMTLAVTIGVLVALKRSFSGFSLAMGFAYPNARFTAMGNEYITRSGVQKLKEARSLEEAVNSLSSRDYEFPAEASGDVEVAAAALSDIETRFFSIMIDEIPKKARPFYRALLYGNELGILREAFIGRFHPSDLARAVRPLQERSERTGDETRRGPEDVRGTVEGILESAGSPPEAAAQLTERYPFLSGNEVGKSLEIMEEKGDFSEFEYLLDREFFNNLKQVSETITPFLRTPARDILKLHSDIFNIRTVLRGAAGGMPPDEIRSRFVPPGGEIAEWKLDMLAGSSSLSEVLEELKDTPFALAVTGKKGDMVEKEEKGGSTGSISAVQLEAALERIMLEKILEIVQRYPNTTGGTLRFMVSKQIEMRNLNVVIRALGEGISPAEYEGLLVMEERTT